jgi:predicted metal-dependent peptidase
MPKTKKIDNTSDILTKEEEDLFRKKIDTILFAFAHHYPFWGVLSERCKYSVTKTKIPTACVDKNGHILFNYDFCSKLTDHQFLFLVAHEISHFVFEHNPRRSNRDPLLWNIAVDYAVNLMLWYQFENDKYIIKDGIFDNSWKTDKRLYDGMNAELIYADIFKNAKVVKISIQDIMGDEENSDGENGEGNTVIRDRRVPLPNKEGKSKEQANQELKDFVNKAICDAYTVAKSQGDMPVGLERIINAHLKSKVDWVTALRQKMRFGTSRLEKKDVTWNSPNRRFLNSDFVFPSNVGPDSPKLAYAVDTSGSMSEKDLDHAISELEDLRKKLNAKVYFLDCDAGVYSSRWINPFEPLPKLKGGGGTDFRPVFDHLNKNGIKPDYCVFFTDGYGEFGETPKLDVLWVMTSDVKPPFGEVIRYNDLNG